jgi:hypothetical protein|tara:strand:- start:433 stop:636 length:204 start_codon:yes stop_codon:yes gene_type:complete
VDFFRSLEEEDEEDHNVIHYLEDLIFFLADMDIVKAREIKENITQIEALKWIDKKHKYTRQQNEDYK